MSNKIALEALTDAKRAINSMKVEAETAGAGGDQEMLQDACEQISNEGLAADTAIRAAIAALQAEPQGWMPIETAPEDENILVATAGGHVDAAFWTDEDGEGRKWWWLVSANEYAKHPIHENLIPTHWMPLPTPPKD